MTGPFLFMGVQPDPDMDNAIGRGFPRIYDGLRELTEEDERIIRASYAERAKRPPYTGPRGVHILTGGGPCVCGRCLWEHSCPEVQP